MTATTTEPATITFEDFYARYYQKIRAFFDRRLPYLESADDWTQESFLRFLERRIELNVNSGYLLFTIARNMVVDCYRRYYRRELMSEEFSHTAVQSANTVENEVYARELSRNFRRLVEKMPPQRRSVYEKIECLDMSISEVSVQMKLSVSTISNHLCRARHDIRRALLYAC